MIDSKHHFWVKLAAYLSLNKVFRSNLPKMSSLPQKISFLNSHYYVPELPGFQNWLILYLLGTGYHAGVVSGLSFYFSFKSTWTHCEPNYYRKCLFGTNVYICITKCQYFLHLGLSVTAVSKNTVCIGWPWNNVISKITLTFRQILSFHNNFKLASIVITSNEQRDTSIVFKRV